MPKKPQAATIHRMAQKKVTVSLAALDGFIAELASFSTHLGEEMESLEKGVADVHTRWSGAAAAAHARAHDEWATGAKMMAEGISRLRRASADAHSNFAAVAKANRELFS